MNVEAGLYKIELDRIRGELEDLRREFTQLRSENTHMEDFIRKIAPFFRVEGEDRVVVDFEKLFKVHFKLED